MNRKQILATYGIKVELPRTGAMFKVVGAMNGKFVPYDAPEFRPAYNGEVTEVDGDYWRMVPNHSGQKLRGQMVTEEVLEEVL